jgi:hypothetical protein
MNSARTSIASVALTSMMRGSLGRSASRPPSVNVSPNTLAARSTWRAPASSCDKRAISIARTVSGSASWRPSATARISSSR